MANLGNHSPPSSSRTLEKVFEDAQDTGQLHLSGRKLKEYPKCASSYDLSDTTVADLSKNRLVEVPAELCDLSSLEDLRLYHNVLRCVPMAIVQLQALVRLNLSRNQLSTIPPFLCKLRNLEILLAANNKLVSLPEEIGQLDRLMDLDVSCNEITHLPPQIGDLSSLKQLNVRRNLLVELPPELCRLHVEKLDVSNNKISVLPTQVQQMTSVQHIDVHNNPLVCPPPQVCSKGRVHIMKYLRKEAIKEERRRGVLTSELAENAGTPRAVNGRTGGVSSKGVVNGTGDMELQSYIDGSPNARRRRNSRRTVDSGYSTTDSISEKSRWSPSPDSASASQPPLLDPYERRPLQSSNGIERQDSAPAGSNVRVLHINTQQQQPPQQQQLPQQQMKQLQQQPDRSPPASHAPPHSAGGFTPPQSLITTKLTPPSPKLPYRPTGGMEYAQQKSSPASFTTTSPQQVYNETNMSGSPSVSGYPPTATYTPTSSPNSYDPFVGYTPPGVDGQSDEGGLVDEFTRELQRQKAAYEQKKRVAEQVRRQRQQQDSPPDGAGPAAGEDEEKTRRAAVRVVEEQRALLEQQRRRHGDGASRQPPTPPRFDLSLPADLLPRSTSCPAKEATNVGNQQPSSSSGSLSSADGSDSNTLRRMPHSKSFRDEERSTSRNTAPLSYRRCISESNQREYWKQNNGGGGDASLDTSFSSQHSSSSLPPDEEFRARHEALISQQRYEAAMVRRRLEEEKVRIRQISDSGGGEMAYSDGMGMESESPCGAPTAVYNGGQDGGRHHPVVRHIPVQYQKALDKLEALSSELDEVNPGFTVRRQLQHAQQERDRMTTLRKLIESRLKMKLPDDLMSALRDGVVLCHLANHIRPRSVSSIHVPSPSVPKLSMAKCRRNVENFLEACRRMGVSESHLVTPAVIIEQKDVSRVTSMVEAVVAIAPRAQHSAV